MAQFKTRTLALFSRRRLPAKKINRDQMSFVFVLIFFGFFGALVLAELLFSDPNKGRYKQLQLNKQEDLYDYDSEILETPKPLKANNGVPEEDIIPISQEKIKDDIKKPNNNEPMKETQDNSVLRETRDNQQFRQTSDNQRIQDNQQARQIHQTKDNHGVNQPLINQNQQYVNFKEIRQHKDNNNLVGKINNTKLDITITHNSKNQSGRASNNSTGK